MPVPTSLPRAYTSGGVTPVCLHRPGYIFLTSVSSGACPSLVRIRCFDVRVQWSVSGQGSALVSRSLRECIDWPRSDEPRGSGRLHRIVVCPTHLGLLWWCNDGKNVRCGACLWQLSNYVRLQLDIFVTGSAVMAILLLAFPMPAYLALDTYIFCLLSTSITWMHRRIELWFTAVCETLWILSSLTIISSLGPYPLLIQRQRYIGAEQSTSLVSVRFNPISDEFQCIHVV